MWFSFLTLHLYSGTPLKQLCMILFKNTVIHFHPFCETHHCRSCVFKTPPFLPKKLTLFWLANFGKPVEGQDQASFVSCNLCWTAVTCEYLFDPMRGSNTDWLKSWRERRRQSRQCSLRMRELQKTIKVFKKYKVRSADSIWDFFFYQICDSPQAVLMCRSSLKLK